MLELAVLEREEYERVERKIRIQAGDVTATATLNDSATADAIWKALPIEARANTWGDEIYFAIPVKLPEESGQEIVQVGDVAYWPPGSAFCIFFGPTPMSRGTEIRPASAVNVVGRIVDDPLGFRRVASGARVAIEPVQS
ncbi:MAG: cyclophilin-like fold protein [Chloroflexota bacterium]